jgi:predicted transcriptional regulator
VVIEEDPPASVAFRRSVRWSSSPDSIRILLRPVRKKAALRQIKRGKKVTATALVTRSGKKISASKQRIALR